jgi:hypothetical protein
MSGSFTAQWLRLVMFQVLQLGCLYITTNDVKPTDIPCVLIPCRALGKLPQLCDCTIYDCSLHPDSLLKPPTSHCLLPLTPIRHFRFIGEGSHDILSLLVMWTRLPHASSAAALPSCNGCYHAVRFDVQATSSANRGWLDTLMHNQLAINFYISQNSNLGSLVPDLQRHSRPMVLTMQSRVEPGVLGEVLAAYSGEQLTLTLSPPPADAAGAEGKEPWEKRLRPRLTDQHLQAMLPHVAKLRSLDLSNCTALSAAAVQELVEGVGDGLTQLCLSDAKNVNDWVLWALLRSCRKLERLELRGAPGVTAAGLAPLLVFLKHRFNAELYNTGVDWAKLKKQVEVQGRSYVFRSEGGAAAFSSDSTVTLYTSWA